MGRSDVVAGCECFRGALCLQKGILFAFSPSQTLVSPAMGAVVPYAAFRSLASGRNLVSVTRRTMRLRFSTMKVRYDCILKRSKPR